MEEELLELYLREAANHRVLTRDEEVALGIRVQTGIRVEAMLAEGVCLLSPKEVERILAEARAARHTFATHNVRLVVQIATREQRKLRQTPRILLEFIQEGMVMLIDKVIPRFDPTRGTKFSTFATWWVRQGITRWLANNGHTIRVPIHVQDTVSRLKRHQSKLEQETGRLVSLRETAESLGVKPEKAELYVQSEADLPSLDAPIGYHDNEGMGDLFIAGDTPDVHDQAEHVELSAALEQALEQLDPRSARVLRLRFGLDGGGDKTLEEVAQRYGLTRERIRQIEVDALRKLRGIPNLKELLRGEFAL